MAVTPDTNASLVTYSLGSCIGVSIWDRSLRVGGLLHYMLPNAGLAPEKAEERPAMFATTGIPALFREAFELGAKKEQLSVRIAGGSQLMDDNNRFNIGRKNYVALRKILFKNGIRIAAEDVGGSISRTMRLDVGTGRVTLTSNRIEREL